LKLTPQDVQRKANPQNHRTEERSATTPPSPPPTVGTKEWSSSSVRPCHQTISHAERLCAHLNIISITNFKIRKWLRLGTLTCFMFSFILLFAFSSHLFIGDKAADYLCISIFHCYIHLFSSSYYFFLFLTVTRMHVLQVWSACRLSFVSPQYSPPILLQLVIWLAGGFASLLVGWKFFTKG